MIGATVMVLWSATVSLVNGPTEVPLPYLNHDYRITEIVGVNDVGNGGLLYINVGDSQEFPTSLVNDYEFDFSANDYVTATVNSVYDMYVPANTLEYLQVLPYQTSTVQKATFDFIGYQVD